MSPVIQQKYRNSETACQNSPEPQMKFLKCSYRSSNRLKPPQIMFATMQILGPASSWKLEPEMFLHVAL